jgi:hypothetical protein
MFVSELIRFLEEQDPDMQVLYYNQGSTIHIGEAQKIGGAILLFPKEV